MPLPAHLPGLLAACRPIAPPSPPIGSRHRPRRRAAGLALALAALPLGVQAQTSSVTLFGVVDLAARYSNNGKVTLKSLESGGMTSSRFGVQGVEDLGGGMKAAFWLEGGFLADSGANAPFSDTPRFWGRRATVSLLGEGLGELRVGRNQTPFFNMYLSFDPFTCNGIGSVMNLIPVMGTRINPASGVGQQDQARGRSDNSVQWGVAPGKAGAYGEVLVSAGEGVSGNRHRGARLGWVQGGANVAMSWGDTQVYTVAKPDNRVREIGVAAAYDFGTVRVIGQVLDRRLDANTRRLYVLSGTWREGPHQLRGTLSRYSDNQRTAAGLSQDARQLSLGYLYGFSRRTSLYATYTRIDNDAGAAQRGSSLAGVAGQANTGLELGLRHGF
jgi:predicted porin